MTEELLTVEVRSILGWEGYRDIKSKKQQVGQTYDAVFGGKYDIHMLLAIRLPARQLSVVSVHKSLINYHAVMHDPLKGTAVASRSFTHYRLLLTASTLVSYLSDGCVHCRLAHCASRRHAKVTNSFRILATFCIACKVNFYLVSFLPGCIFTVFWTLLYK